mmetsp:Transcript_5940/g.7762  ORF Transcript_5940/g.7762 Transcript_5940/m.7762 type:complete len:521 (-) Transcript_5940:131-1693(-)|eukprot:CAMPEP_0204870802 /NCGR_PEP_ID=MMETSP1348-20121228/33685_1 /ASSEMBLY_ACC=CAM_ASM_000700 /TAXON_ID=215587 /ORGANISM="Aplanochytrium stocchinoi, Strain GSBS06" /LENGTH=520 /DNA_ID=CAMNT_0052024831 /DNA_START=117 /DNA_END=1679 /DNA_ORIENTATION=-
MSKVLKAIRLLEHLLFAVAVSRVISFLRKYGIAGVIKGLVSSARNVPGLKNVVNNELSKEVRKIEEKMLGKGDAEANVELPEAGYPTDKVFNMAKRLHDDDNFGTGKAWAGIYHDVTGEEPVGKLQDEIWALYNNSNSLYPGIFKSCRKFEAEIVQMAVSLLHGNESCCGLLTSGGTESILIAVLGYRELALQRGITKPEIICCRNAHGALDKAAHYFGVKLIKLEAKAETLSLDPSSVKSVITRNTIAVYASAPSFPSGVVDPIENIAAICKKHNLGLHVDNCLGGFYLSCLQARGLFAKKFDFQVDGVTSISIDIHKYGFAPKGVSVVTFSTKELRRLTIYPVSSGLTLYVTPTLQGSRGGGVIAAAWATMMYYGKKGYEDVAVRLHEIKEKVEREVENIPGLKLPVKADLAVIPITSDEFDIYAVATLMEKRGWSTFTSQNPPLMQLCYGEQHYRVIDDWLKDLKECALYVANNPGAKIEGDAAVYGAAKMLPVEVLDDIMKSYIEVKMTVKQLKEN